MLAHCNGIDIHYEITGSSGPWITFSHSLAADLTMWRDQVAHFARTHRVLCVDTRGHGRSSAPATAYTLEELASDLRALLDHLGIERTHFVGLSMGGMIGQTFALRYPGRLASLVLADTTSRYGAEAQAMWAGRVKAATEGGMAPLVEATLSRWFTAPWRADPAHAGALAEVGNMIRNTPAAGYAGCCHALPKIDVTHRLAEISAPILVICGAQDEATPPAMAQAIAAGAPGAELVMIDQAAHLSNLEQPAAFNAAIERFITRHG
jgi:3-oxoadipate enol-lactonase